MVGELLNNASGCTADVPQQAGTLAGDEVYERFRGEGLDAGKLAGVAPRGAPADAPGLEHDGLVAALGAVERGGDAGVAAARDADVAALRAGQRRQARQPPGRGEGARTRAALGALTGAHGSQHQREIYFEGIPTLSGAAGRKRR